MQTLKTVRCWVAFDREKRTVDIVTGKRGLRWRAYADVRRWVGEPEPLRDYYLGLSLTPETDCLCIDIDERLSPQEVETLAQSLEQQIGHRDFSMEYSMSGHLHIFLRIPLREIPKSFRRAKGTFKGYRAEFYAVGQSILLTEQWAAQTKPVYALRKPTRWESIEPDCTCESIASIRENDAIGDEALHYQPKRRNIFLDILHLFPSFYAPYLKDTFVEEPNPHLDRIHLRRPGKDHGISATAFIDTGVLYNFSTNWPETPHHQGITLAEFIARQEKTTIKHIARRFYQYLKETSQTLGIPIPRRKRHLYFTIKRKHYYQFLTALILFYEDSMELIPLLQTLQQLTRHKISPVSLQKHLYELLKLNIIERIRVPHVHKYKYQLTDKGESIIRAILRINAIAVNKTGSKKKDFETLPLDLGWNLLIFVMELNRDPDSKEPIAESFRRSMGKTIQELSAESAALSPPHQTFTESGKESIHQIRYWQWSLVVYWLRWYRRSGRAGFWRPGVLFGCPFGVLSGGGLSSWRVMRSALVQYWWEVYRRAGSYRGYLFLLDELLRGMDLWVLDPFA